MRTEALRYLMRTEALRYQVGAEAMGYHDGSEAIQYSFKASIGGRHIHRHDGYQNRLSL